MTHRENRIGRDSIGRWSGLFMSLLFAALPSLLIVSGCGDFFSRKPTEAESIEVLRELRQVRESPGVGNPLPELYRQPPARVEIKGGVKVFYFTRHHPPEYLARLLGEQLGVQASVNSSTNQIVAFTKDNTQADQVIAYLDMIDVPPVQINVDCLILERFGDVTMDWESSILIENFLGEGITLGEERGTFNNQGELIDLEPAFPGASLREAEREKFGLDFGYWMDKHVPGHQVRAIVDMLVSRGYLKILLNPTLETVNGREATVTIRDYTPIEKVQTGQGGASDAYNITEYVWVEDTLTVTPMVYSDGSVGLTTAIKIGSRSKPEGVIQRSIITERMIVVEENRIKPGESLVIGGMRKSEKRSVIRGVPFFKDLPIIGILFSSKDFEEKGTEIIFILTPSISSGGQDHTEVVQDIRTKFADPEYKFQITDMLTDPFGGGAYTGMMEKQAAETEIARIQAEAEAEEAQEALLQQQKKAEKAAMEAEILRKQSLELKAQAQQALENARKAQEESQKIQQETQATQQQAAEAAAKLNEAAEQARKAQEEADRAVQQAAEAQKKAQQIEQQVRQTQEEAEAARQALEKAKAEAERREKEELEAQQREAERLEAAEPQAQAPAEATPEPPAPAAPAQEPAAPPAEQPAAG